MTPDSPGEFTLDLSGGDLRWRVILSLAAMSAWSPERIAALFDGVNRVAASILDQQHPEPTP